MLTTYTLLLYIMHASTNGYTMYVDKDIKSIEYCIKKGEAYKLEYDKGTVYYCVKN